MHAIPALGAALPLASGHAPSQPAAATPAAAPAAAVPEPSPRMRLDPALGLVVLEFRNDRGEVVQTLPDARQLAAYRRAPPHR
jgi:hypothetical protein